jgi:DNA primase
VFKELMWESLAERTGLSRNKLSEILSQHQANHADQQPDNRKSREKNSNNYPDAPPEYYQDDSAAPDNPSIRPVKNPKQRPALETVLEPHSDKALYAIGILTLFPNLGSRLDGRQLPNPEQENRLTLLNELLALVYKRPDSSTHMILGHWLEAPWKGLIEQGLSAASLFDSNMVAETDPETELSETVSYLSKQFKQADLTLQVDKLAAEGYGQLSKEKLQQLNQLIKQKHEL